MDQQQIPGLGASYSLRQEMRVSFCLLPLFMGWIEEHNVTWTCGRESHAL